jgi:hypothetical protein
MNELFPPNPSSAPDSLYKPGDMANGHVLTEHGQWVPVGPAPKKQKSVWGRWYMITAYVMVALIAIGSATSGGGEPTVKDKSFAAAPSEAPTPAEDTVIQDDDATPDAPVVSEEPVESEAPAPAPKPKPAPKPEFTVSQEQAIESAESYLDFSAFSRLGLIDQLSSEYGEGFSTADATFAVDHITVDWNEQAAKSAKSYLEFSSFSRAGLIDQLVSEYGEQFTQEQAVYGVNQTGL